MFVYVSDPSSGRNYVIQVDESVKTCEQADNWMYQGRETWNGKKYKQIART